MEKTEDENKLLLAFVTTIIETVESCGHEISIDLITEIVNRISGIGFPLIITHKN